MAGRTSRPLTLREYQERLLRIIDGRYDDIRSGRVAAASWAVPGIHSFLDALRDRGIALVLASGSEVTHVRREAEMLGLASYFNEAVFAPVGDDPHFTKRAVIDQL